MNNGKYANRKGIATKAMVMILAVMLIVGISVGGTLAWLSDSTTEVKNTFTTSDIDIELNETTGGENKEFKMVPGYTIKKDPTVKVIKGSEKCYLFVKVEKSENFDTFMTYEMADGWIQLMDKNEAKVVNVFYRVVDAAEADASFSVLENNQVSVEETVTKEQMNALTTTTYPTLTVTAYASQYMKNASESFEAYEAWDNVNYVAE